jgi:hypothetical protein
MFNTNPEKKFSFGNNHNEEGCSKIISNKDKISEEKISEILQRCVFNTSSNLNSFNNGISDNRLNSTLINYHEENARKKEIIKNNQKEKLSEFIFLKKKLTREDVFKIKRVYLNENNEDNVKNLNKKRKIIKRKEKSFYNLTIENQHLNNNNIIEGNNIT